MISGTKKFVGVLSCIFFVFLLAGCKSTSTSFPAKVVQSKDGSLISYFTKGSGNVALVFIHGWSCDSRYWNNQVEVFSKKHKFIAVDLAGHGHSSSERENYTISSFAEDVKAVVEDVHASKVVLIGHSMGGGVIAEAACLMPDKVIALIGVDTLQNVEYKLTQVEFDNMIKPLANNFKQGVKDFVSPMFIDDVENEIKGWVLDDMSAAPKRVALSALNNYLSRFLTGESAKVFTDVKVPVYAINATLWPTDKVSNLKYMKSFDLTLIENAGHFLMLENPDVFNSALEKCLKGITDKF